MSKEQLSPRGRVWKEVRQELFTPEERAASRLRVTLMIELTRARNEQGLSQKKLEELSGVKQPVIARLESAAHSPQINSMIKILKPLGYTLAVVKEQQPQN